MKLQLMKLRGLGWAVAMASAIAAAPAAMAMPISVMVGDNDGYGFGVLDNGTAIWPGAGPFGSNFDGRSAAEAGATNGAQITDIYSAIFPAFGPNTAAFATVFLPFAGTLNSATLTIDMGDFQSSAGGAILADINSVGLSLAFDDGFQNTVVRDFVLSPAMIAAANLSGRVELNLNHAGSGDLIAFDYFKLTGDVSVPEPATVLLTGLGLVGLGLGGRRRVR